MSFTHDFNFDGGDILSKIGATWFVSYTYYLIIDKNHIAWKNVKTYPTRIAKYNSSTYYHEYWLEQIKYMNNLNLAKNAIGIEPENTKLMAKIILEKCLLN